jgi:hypothetical protein
LLSSSSAIRVSSQAPPLVGRCAGGVSGDDSEGFGDGHGKAFAQLVDLDRGVGDVVGVEGGQRLLQLGEDAPVVDDDAVCLVLRWHRPVGARDGLQEVVAGQAAVQEHDLLHRGVKASQQHVVDDQQLERVVRVGETADQLLDPFLLTQAQRGVAGLRLTGSHFGRDILIGCGAGLAGVVDVHAETGQLLRGVPQRITSESFLLRDITTANSSGCSNAASCSPYNAHASRSAATSCALKPLGAVRVRKAPARSRSH